MKHENMSFDFLSLKHRIMLSIKESALLEFNASSSSQLVPIFGLLGLSQLRPRAPKLIQVFWRPPEIGWVKVNTDGSFHNHLSAGYGGIFRNNEALFLGAFANKVTVPSALDAEVFAVIEAVNIAMTKGWCNLWVEVDSLVLLTYLRYPNRVPWRLLSRWSRCLHMISHLNFRISHIFKEGNSAADSLARFGASHDGWIWWDVLPSFLTSEFGRDINSQPAYRFA